MVGHKGELLQGGRGKGGREGGREGGRAGLRKAGRQELFSEGRGKGGREGGIHARTSADGVPSSLVMSLSW